jgi:DNA-directed RNA polymerase specialized sigma24 family protein
MKPDPPVLEEFEHLAARSGWIEGLVQDAWVEALRRGAGARGPLSAWMAGAVKRLALNRLRSEARRRRRESEHVMAHVAAGSRCSARP